MKKEWNDIVVTQIRVAIYVAPNAGKRIHENRPFHGFVLNDENSIKDYYFSDGEILHTEGSAFFICQSIHPIMLKRVKRGAATPSILMLKSTTFLFA